MQVKTLDSPQYLIVYRGVENGEVHAELHEDHGFARVRQGGVEDKIQKMHRARQSMKTSNKKTWENGGFVQFINIHHIIGPEDRPEDGQ